MAVNALSKILGGTLDLTPHVELGAFKYSMRRYAMASRATVYTDMTGFNSRKVSEYIRARRAQKLTEDTAIPDGVINRVRMAEISPEEYGDRYRITDRRSTTDLESILTDTVTFLGQAIGDTKEALFMQVALANFTGGLLGSPATTYDPTLPIKAQVVFKQNAQRQQLYHVAHPYQLMDVMVDYAKIVGANVGINTDFRQSALNGFFIPAWDNLNIVMSEFLPRKIVHKVAVYGTGGTFRLEIGMGQEIGVNITAPITVSATPATMCTNIANALNALTFEGNGTWTCTGSDIEDLTVTAPIYLDAESELRVATDVDNPTLPNRWSEYDLVTSLAGNEPSDINGHAIGVQVLERSASCRSLLFARDAIVYDIRQPVKSYQELVHQGRTAEISAYEKYGVGVWKDQHGMFIETDATSPLAVA